MPYLPAICPNGHIFNSSIFVENIRDATFNGFQSQCTYCGNMGSIPDGLYNVIDNSIKYLSSPSVSKDTLQKLKGILEDAREKKEDFSKISNTIKQETPELTTFTDFFPKNRTELYAFLGLILMFITWIQSNNLDNKDPNEIINIINNSNTIIHNNQTIIDNKTARSLHINSMEKKQHYPKVGRNELCPCESGKKYKLCHGK